MDDAARVPGADECVVAPLLERWARQRPMHPFLEFDAGSPSFARWDFAAMLQRTRRAAGALRALGLGRGERLLSLMPNRPETVLGWFGANWLGATYVPINTAWRGALLQHAVALADARVLLVHASLLPRLLELDWPRLRAVNGVTLREVVVLGDARDHAMAATAAGLRMHDSAVLEHATGIDAAPAVEPLGHELDPVHLRHDRPVEGRAGHLPAGLVRRRLRDGTTSVPTIACSPTCRSST
jgi:crotonobetaine/carnitine-CoA ligase